MRRIASVLLLVFAVVAFFTVAKAKHSQESQPSCSMAAEEALRNWEKLKPGITRDDVEKMFIRDGGMQFPRSTKYVLPSCGYIKVRIEFEPAPNKDMFAAEDVVTKVSPLFVAYPSMD